MMAKKVFFFLILFVMLATACAAPPSTTQAPVETQAPAATEAPAPREAPTEAPAATEAPTPAPEQPKPGVAGHLVLATTTSTENSGLLAYLLPMFEEEAGVKVDVIAVGSGQALKLGEDGNADVLLVHSRKAEDEFMAAKHGTRREDVMYNDFIIVGPESDPAGIKGMGSAAEAFTKIAQAQQPFVSRGDESGTHVKEKNIWAATDVKLDGEWYVPSGLSMGEVLAMTEEMQGYTLTDRATYLAQTKEGLDLDILVEGDKTLFNPYGVIAVDPAKNPNIQGELAQQFIDWLISVPTQEKIAEFGKEDFGQSLFYPDSQPWREAQ